MGMQFEFFCRNCGYTAGVSGGRDCGFRYVSQTIVCKDCQELYDAEANENAADVLVDGKIRGKLTGICCPRDPTHKFVIFRRPWKCPKCEKPLERGDAGLCCD